MINTSASATPIRFNIHGSFQPRHVRVDQIAPPSLSAANTMANPNVIKIEQGDAQINGQAVNSTIPPYGAVIFALSQDANSGIGMNDANSIKDYLLYCNHPNPFNPKTVIRYDAPRAGHVRLQILDVLGRRVKVLVDEQQSSGSYAVEWDGTDENNMAVSSGVYAYELTTGTQLFVKKMSLVR